MNIKNILVLAAHADDEVLGCGGTIAKLVKFDCSVTVVFFTNGVGSRQTDDTAEVRRNQAAYAACEELGVQNVFLHNFPDNQMDGINLLKVVKIIEGYIAEICPDTIFTHHAGDLNVDHRQVFLAAITAARPVPDASVKNIFSFEVQSSTEWGASAAPTLAFNPTTFFDITGTIDKKLAAMMHYHEELRAAPHPRSLELISALAKVRGSTVGVDYAEAFQLIRQVY